MFLSEQLENRMFLSVTVATPAIEPANAEPRIFQLKQEGLSQYLTDSQEGVAAPESSTTDGGTGGVMASNPDFAFSDKLINGASGDTIIADPRAVLT